MAKTDTTNPRKLTVSRILQKITGVFLIQMRRIWRHLPASLRLLPPGKAYGRQLHRFVRLHADRKQYFATFFLRNRPEMELMRRLVDQRPPGSRLDMTILACSKGAEVYSMMWVIRSARPDLQLNMHAVDISQEIADFAANGVYLLDSPDEVTRAEEEAAKRRGEVSWNTFRDQGAAWMFERMSKDEIDGMFEVEGNRASVRPWLKQGITWLCADAGDSKLREAIGLQDIVMANRFLCHMKPPEALSCLRNIGRLVKPGGYLFVSGLDLDVRTTVALEMGWKPVTDLIREIHEGDDSIRSAWPMDYWGLEPFDDRRPDFQIRYASVYQVGEAPCNDEEFASYESSRR
jgi:chemotaxis methyl-accepting protein methylase